MRLHIADCSLPRWFRKKTWLKKHGLEISSSEQVFELLHCRKKSLHEIWTKSFPCCCSSPGRPSPSWLAPWRRWSTTSASAASTSGTDEASSDVWQYHCEKEIKVEVASLAFKSSDQIFFVFPFGIELNVYFYLSFKNNTPDCSEFNQSYNSN